LKRGNFAHEKIICITELSYKEKIHMKQLNNSSTPKGRKVFSRRILFFSFFILAVIALALGLWF